MKHFKYFPELKVDFRAVPYASKHVLEYRINPNQDITYYQEISVFGLFKFKIKRKFDTSWKQPYLFHCSCTSKYYPEDNDMNYMPLFIYRKSHLDEYKRDFKAIGMWMKWMDKKEEEEKAKYKYERNAYLEEHTTWE